ncbi:MAG: insulinase family protein [Deltaproteobacteria bacterium]|nr:insulinase family protein [Deltaproteobacteria bacterium]
MKPIIEQLENGLRIVLRPSHAAPVVAFQMWVGVGSADERGGEEGLAHVFEHMLFKGTKTRAVGEIARDVERAGGHINAWTSHDETVFFITLANRYWRKGLDILADAVQNPSLDQDELQRELAVIREEIRMGADSPDRAVVEKLFGRVFKRHPYGRPVIGFDRTVKRFTREMVAAFYKRWYTPSNMVFVVAGDFELKAMRKRIEAAFGGFRGKKAPNRATRVSEPPQRKIRLAHAIKPVSEAHLALGFPIPGLAHEDVPALDLLAAIIGQGASSRLETIVRRKLSLVNGIRSIAYTPHDAGLLGVFAVMPPHHLERASRAIFDEFLKVTAEPVSTAELEKSRTLLESDKIYSEETVDGIARKLGFYALHAGDISFEEKYLAAIKDVGPGDIVEVARRYISPKSANIAVVVPDPAGQAPKKRVSWIVGRAAARKIDGKKLEGALAKQLKVKPLRKKTVVSPSSSIKTVARELPTGDVLLVRHDPSSRLVAARAAFLGGQRLERKSQAGLNALLSSAITRGTEKLSAEEIALEMDELACSVGGFSGRNTIGVHGEFLKSNFGSGFALMADCLRHPSFPDTEVEREKELLIEEIRSSRHNPGHRVFQIFNDALFGKHPYGRPATGREDTIKPIKGGDLKRHLIRDTRPGTMVLAIVGGVNVDEATELVEQHILAGSTRGRAPAAPGEWRPPSSPRQVLDTLPKEQSHVVIGFPGTTITNQDRFALEVLIEILGGHGGRLFEGVREKRGLAYAVTATSMEGIEPGSIAVYAATSPGQEAAVVQAMLEEIERTRKDPPTSRELTRVKRHLVGSRSIALQRSAAWAANLSLNYLYGNGYDTAEKYPGRIDAVTREAVQHIAVNYLDPSRPVVACVGPNSDSLDLV